MISRRALLGTGAGVVVAAGAIAVGSVTHRFDDVADTIGLKPKPQPVASDDTLIIRVAKDQDRVLAAIESTSARHPDLTEKLAPFAKIAQEHVTAVGGSTKVPTTDPIDTDPVTAIKALGQILSTAAAARTNDSTKAVSPDLARVLASMSAGLAQGSRAVGALV